MQKDPKTKPQVVDRLLNFRVADELRTIGEAPASITRTGANRVLLKFPASNKAYELVVRNARPTPETSFDRLPTTKRGQRRALSQMRKHREEHESV
jgi:hypothetical protein